MLTRGLWLIIVLAILIVGLFAVQKSLLNLKTNEALPEIQGVLLNNPKQLPRIDLINHHDELITQDDLKHRWSIIAYGYTHCPDVCPMLLVTLADVEKVVKRQLANVKASFYFYTVDPLRDSTERLKAYVPYFSPSFIGVKAISDKDKAIFERSLGIRSVIDGLEKGSYKVSHSQSIFLINPKGQLQAVFMPVKRGDEILPFDSNQIYEDYVKVLRYYLTSISD